MVSDEGNGAESDTAKECQGRGGISDRSASQRERSLNSALTLGVTSIVQSQHIRLPGGDEA
jgi:hypothetical protein